MASLINQLTRSWRPTLTLASLIHLWSCSSVAVEQYSANRPVLVMEEFFRGELQAHGIVKNRGGEVIRYFNADICARWSSDGKGTLEELFIFNDGEHQTRTWVLTPAGTGRYQARANDVVGTSLATIAGNALAMDYVLEVPYRKWVLDVGVKDRMYLVNPTTIINESTLRKWGFTVGSVVLTIRRTGSGDAC